MNLDGEIVAHYGSGSNGLLTNEISTIGLDKNKNLYVAAYKLGIQYLKIINSFLWQITHQKY